MKVFKILAALAIAVMVLSAWSYQATPPPTPAPIPIYEVNGTPAKNLHEVIGHVDVNPKGITITLSGAAAFTDASTYSCSMSYESTGAAIGAYSVWMIKKSGTEFILRNSGGTFPTGFRCIGY